MFSFSSKDDTKVLKVCRVSKEIQAYKNSKTDKMMKYFNLVCAENMKTYHVRVYLTGKYEMFKEGMTYKFKNSVAKGENELWVTKDTTIAYAVHDCSPYTANSTITRRCPTTRSSSRLAISIKITIKINSNWQNCKSK